jgi:hypothetical protein
MIPVFNFKISDQAKETMEKLHPAVRRQATIVAQLVESGGMKDVWENNSYRIGLQKTHDGNFTTDVVFCGVMRNGLVVPIMPGMPEYIERDENGEVIFINGESSIQDIADQAMNDEELRLVVAMLRNRKTVNEQMAYESMFLSAIGFKGPAYEKWVDVA